MKKQIYPLLCSLLLTGCTVGPDYAAPCLEVPDEFVSTEYAQNPEFLRGDPIVNWWDLFEDPLLSSYIEASASYNYNARAALENITAARGLRAMASSRYLPTINADTTYGLNTLSSFLTSSIGAGVSPTTAFIPNTNIELFFAGFDAVWEIDLFGRTRRDVEAATARIESAEENYHDVLVSIFGEVAVNYVEARSFQERITIAEQKIAALQTMVDLIKELHRAGLTTKIDVNAAIADIAHAQSTVPKLYAGLHESIYRLSVLTGNYPDHLLQEMLIPRPLPNFPCDVHTGLPSDLLRRRPDLRKAERELAALTADIGVAIANLFPSFILGAQTGEQAMQTLRQLIDKFLYAYSFDLGMPLFRGGRDIANIHVARARARQALYEYEGKVLAAMQEVEQSLFTTSQELKRSSALGNAVEKQMMIYKLQTDLFKGGLGDKLSVIEAEKALLNDKLVWVDSKTTALINLVSLNKALGGGWQPCCYPSE